MAGNGGKFKNGENHASRPPAGAKAMVNAKASASAKAMASAGQRPLVAKSVLTMLVFYRHC